MAALGTILKGKSDAYKNKIVDAGLNKAKDILVSVSPTPTALKYAAALLSGAPSNQVINGAVVVLQDTVDPDDAAIQGAVDTVVDKLIEAEG